MISVDRRPDAVTAPRAATTRPPATSPRPAAATLSPHYRRPGSRTKTPMSGHYPPLARQRWGPEVRDTAAAGKLTAMTRSYARSSIRSPRHRSRTTGRRMVTACRHGRLWSLRAVSGGPPIVEHQRRQPRVPPPRLGSTRARPRTLLPSYRQRRARAPSERNRC